MTEKQANEILRTKYPEATIFRRNSMGGTSSSALAVTFYPNGKVYDYQASSYQQVLEKLGFNILYKHNVKNMMDRIEKLQKKISDGGEDTLHLFGEKYHTFTADELSSMQDEIDKIASYIADSIII